MKTLDYFVKKYNIDVKQKSPIEIIGVGRLDILRWIRELDFTVGAEIGVEAGRYAELICQQNTQVKLYGVDPYLKYDEYNEYKNQELMEAIYRAMKERMNGYENHGQYVVVRKKSMDALTDFKNESLDFVYIDANHEGNFPYNDIKGWAKKVKKGGLIMGHDYVRVKSLNFTIKDALTKYTVENKIHPWFILGSYQKRRREVRDVTRSWLIIK